MKKLMITLVSVLLMGTLATAFAAPQTPAPSRSQAMSGKLTSKDGKLFLKDEATHKVVEVRGEGLQEHVGQRVALQGELFAGATDSPEVLVISEASRKAAAGAPGSKAAAAGVKSGWSKVAIVGVAGAGTAATIGSLYAADVIGGQEKPVSPR
jgi:hypothetical protein